VASLKLEEKWKKTVVVIGYTEQPNVYGFVALKWKNTQHIRARVKRTPAQ
jgi:hypothetical protein